MEKVNDKIYYYLSNEKLNIERIMKQYNNYIATIIKNSSYKFSQEDQEEIILDVYLTLWNNKSKLDINKSMSSYIAGITKNLLLKKLRNKKISYNIEDYESELLSLQNIELEYVKSKENEAVIESLNNLKDEDREIFLLYYYEDMKIKQIADVYHMSESKIKSKLFRARKKIKKVLKERGEI